MIRNALDRALRSPEETGKGEDQLTKCSQVYPKKVRTLRGVPKGVAPGAAGRGGRGRELRRGMCVWLQGENRSGLIQQELELDQGAERFGGGNSPPWTASICQ